jgi:formylglycine-generating enzyme required for sulfatase activity
MRKNLFILVIIAGLLIPFNLFAQSRGLQIKIKNLDSDNEIGKQYLVLIAIDRYQSWNPLKSPVKDAEDIRKILESRYYIDKVMKLYDNDATKTKIIELLKELQKKLNQEDSIFIFYAGHGHLDEASNLGHWIPVDGGVDENKQENWISNAHITGLIRKMKSKHILLILDSCFSGDILDAHREKPPTICNEYFKKAYKRRSRQILTSGASERVPDSSNFARQLKLALKENKKPYLDPFMLYNEIRLAITDTLPMFGFLPRIDHQKGASFLLFLKESTEPPIDQPELEFSDLENEAKWAEWQKNFREKVDRLKEYDKNDGIAADSKKNAWERLIKAYNQNNPYSDKDKQLRNYAKEKIRYWKGICEDKSGDVAPSADVKTEAKNKKEEDKPADVKAVESKTIRVYKNDKGFWEAVYEDGIVMVYIPAVEFTMGASNGAFDEKPIRKIYLDGYWMGKYEVTFDQYDKYCVKTKKKKPSDQDWGRGKRPVINVSLNDVDEYCKWLSKKIGLKFKLPTEAQWEKAARGIKGRKYPWGDHEPYYKGKCYANYAAHDSRDKKGEDGFENTAPVGSYPQGESPYGLMDMAGNVWEWCNVWYGSYNEAQRKNPKGPKSGTYRVMRGGSWGSYAGYLRCGNRGYDRPSYRADFLGFRLSQDNK